MQDLFTSICIGMLMCVLCFCQTPPLDAEFGVTAARALNSIVWGKNCAIRIVTAPNSTGQEGRGKYANKGEKTDKYGVVLYALPDVTDLETQLDQSIDDYINANTWMVKNGLARVSVTAAKMIRRKGSRKASTDTFSTDLLEALQEAQEVAHREHLRM